MPTFNFVFFFAETSTFINTFSNSLSKTANYHSVAEGNTNAKSLQLNYYRPSLRAGMRTFVQRKEGRCWGLNVAREARLSL